MRARARVTNFRETIKTIVQTLARAEDVVTERDALRAAVNIAIRACVRHGLNVTASKIVATAGYGPDDLNRALTAEGKESKP